MKKLIHSSLLIAVSLLFIYSCSKEEIVLNQQNTFSEEAPNQEIKLNTEETAAVNSLKDEINSISIEKNGLFQVTPENINNPYDSFGKYMESFILHMNNSEKEKPSQNDLDYITKAETYLTANPYGLDFSQVSLVKRPLFTALSNLTVNTSLINNSQLAIAGLKIIENTLATGPLANLLSLDEKKLLLNFTAMMKYTRDYTANNAVTVGTETFEPNALSANCFDYYFNQGAYAGFSVLTNWSNPPLAIAGWVGLPGTIVGSVANGIYQGIVNC